MRLHFRWKTLLPAVVLGLLAMSGTAVAKSSYMSSFRTTYPAAVGSRIDSCLLCHTTASVSSSARNVYGAAYGGANHSYSAINSADSDGDGFTNQVEIGQFFFPGNAADRPAVTALPTVTIAATDPTATEAGTTTGQYTLTRTGGTTAALTVNYTVGGTATMGSDFLSLSGSVQIPAGSATATVTVTPVNDTAVEADESVVVTLSANAAYSVGAAASATVTIQSDDVALATVTIAATDPIATEAGTTTGQFTLTRTGSTVAALTVNYTVGGTATAGSDYLALSGTVQIQAGSATATLTVMPINDATVEPDETVVATLGAGAGYNAGAAAAATVTIQSDDVVATRTLTVASTNPPSGVVISASPNDNNNMGNGSTQFSRVYNQGVQLTLTASSTAGGAGFNGWSGCTSASGATCLVTMDTSLTVTANYSVSSGSSAYVLWTRGDTGVAALWRMDPERATGSPAVIPLVSSSYLYRVAGVGAGWQATSYQEILPNEGYVLWAHGESGKAALWKIDPSRAAGSPAVIPIVSSSYLFRAAGVGAGWQATSYQQVGPNEGYVLWSHGESGKAALWKIDPSQAAGAPSVIPIVSSAYLYSAAGVGASWQATSYQHVGPNEGYVLWTRDDTGQAALWKIAPATGTSIIPISENLYSSPRVGGPWQATSYQHVGPGEGHLLWTRGDTGQAAVWKIDPAGFSREFPAAADAAYLYVQSGVGGPWLATGYFLSGANGAAAADLATSADGPAAVAVIKSGSGAGTILFAGATCGPACKTVALPYTTLETVAVTAAEGSRFAGWETADKVATDIRQAQPGETVYALFEQY